MTLHGLYYVEYRVRELLGEWLDAQGNDFDALDQTEQRRRRQDQHRIIIAQVTAEVERETTEMEALLSKRIKNSPLAAHITAYYSDSALRDSLVAERDARIKQIENEYADRLPTPREHIERYNRGRITFLVDTLKHVCLEICTSCKEAKSLVKLVFLEGNRIYVISDCMSRKSGIEHFSELKRLCLDCIERARHPREQDDPDAESVYCDIRETLERPDGIYAQYGREWKRVPESCVSFSFGDRSDYISDQEAEKWRIPPELHCRNGCLTVQGSVRYDGLQINPL